MARHKHDHPKPRPMVGLLAKLTSEQRKRAIGYRGDDTFGPVRLTSEEVKPRVERRMAIIDALTPDQRKLVHEYGWKLVKCFLDEGVTAPKKIRHLIHIVLHELSPIQGQSIIAKKED